MPSANEELRQQHAALTTGAGVADLGERTQVEMTGLDRAAFLHGFCTNDIKRLVAGQGCEAFLTTIQGKTLAYLHVYCQPDSLALDAEPEHASAIIDHLDRYIIREDVQLADRSAACTTLLAAGPDAADLIGRAMRFDAAVPGERLAHTQGTWEGHAVWVRRTDYTGEPGYFLQCARELADQLRSALIAAGATGCLPDAVEMARIEAGTPRFGCDITPDNLPQEVDRNERAISFTKGCYLGQETVARIDALGHVNRTLRAVRFAGNQVPQAGHELRRDGKPVGGVTSATWSLRLDAPLALAYVRRGSNQPGTQLESDVGAAEVIACPVAAG